MKRFAVVLVLFFASIFIAYAGMDRPVVRLYPDQPDRQSEEVVSPGHVSNIHTPTLTVFMPEKANGTSVIVCPGGGYAGLAIEKEGVEIAEWFNSFGVTAFVLKYRLKEYKYPAAQTDALTAIATVREHAENYNIDPKPKCISMKRMNTAMECSPIVFLCRLTGPNNANSGCRHEDSWIKGD
jgi:acetyl esterase/lipase